MATPSKNNRSEFAAIESAAEALDELSPDQQRRAVALLAARYSWKVSASYKPPSQGLCTEAETHAWLIHAALKIQRKLRVADDATNMGYC